VVEGSSNEKGQHSGGDDRVALSAFWSIQKDLLIVSKA